MIFTGSGNNGGDGSVIARLLLEQGAKPQVVSLVDLEKLQGDAARNLEWFKQLAMPLFTVLLKTSCPGSSGWWRRGDLLVDALLARASQPDTGFLPR